VKPNFRRGPDERDAIKYAAHLRAKEKRRSVRNRKRGSMKPQGLEEPDVHPVGIGLQFDWIPVLKMKPFLIHH
jgi:hypothetical protein